MNNQINAQLQNLDQAATSFLDTRTKIGARMNTLDQQTHIGADVKLAVRRHAVRTCRNSTTPAPSASSPSSNPHWMPLNSRT